MALSSLTPSNMLGELGRLASWLKGDCLAPEEYAGLAVTEKGIFVRIRPSSRRCSTGKRGGI
ncbi:unnamed protein product [Chrysodeixis includens]|uniref:Uncharacterized protein n=1 Tax=Chrysodeixis includens TaxID=689277 RepID=A0A9N8KZ14_CHRIL|nr:unnamed protein product [Chrysodeixis includens]